ncbi:uncharacterized protein METZ01_LOCUS355707, partial [marine metagenome]
KLSSAQSIGEDDVLTFTAPVHYFRAQQDNTGVTPAPRLPQWTIVRTYTIWNSNTTYSLHDIDPAQNPYVYYQDTVWRAVVKNTGKAPNAVGGFWVRGDICGKLLESCKIRFQCKHQMPGTVDFINSYGEFSAHGIPTYDTNNTPHLPFGGFPGSRKFR